MSIAKLATIDDLLGQYGRFGINLGLERIQRLLANLGHPQAAIPVVHVAGTNGKGSVCAYLSAILTAAGYRVGRYTSPHLVSWTERICLNEQPIAPEVLLAVLEEVIAAIRPGSADEVPEPTQFEILTAAAWLYFARQQVEIAVVEVGLGGRLDATNVCEQPLVSVITSLSRDHWQRLGSTLGEIAGEKAGILKPGCPAVVGPLPPDAAVVVKTRLEALGCPVTWPSPARRIPAPALATQDLPGQPFSQQPLSGRSWDAYEWAESLGFSYPLPLSGEFQLTNSALAIATIQQLQQQGWQISQAAIWQGMANTHWPGRLQWLNWQGQQILIDGAHNPAAALELRRYVDQRLADQKLTWVIGMIATKDHREMLQALLRPGDALYLLPVPGHITADPDVLATMANVLCADLHTCQVAANLWSGLESAAAWPERQIILCGSLYLIGEFLKQTIKAS